MSEIVSLKLSELQMNPAQPPLRLSDSAVRPLLLTITESGQISPIQVLRWNGSIVICDGHRRFTIAKALNREEINCEFLESKYPPAIWFQILNKSTRTFKGTDWFYTWAIGATAEDRAAALPFIQARVRHEIEDTIDLFGEERAMELGRKGEQAPGICKYVREATNALSQFSMGAETPEQRRVVAEWLLRHRQSNEVRRLLADDGRKNRQKVRRLQLAVQQDTTIDQASIPRRKKSFAQLPGGDVH